MTNEQAVFPPSKKARQKPAVGKLITFEGGEGAGKTTLLEKVTASLAASFDVLSIRAPGTTGLGEAIRELLLHKKEWSISERAELFLFLAERAQLVEEVIRPALARGQIVLCDRFNDSTIAYQGVGRRLGKERVLDLCAFATKGLQPDLTLYLDLDPHLGLERAQKLSPKDRIEEEALAFHLQIREAFLTLAEEDPDRFHCIDATLTPQEVERQALSLIHALL